jgi:hypothetical protein
MQSSEASQNQNTKTGGDEASASESSGDSMRTNDFWRKKVKFKNEKISLSPEEL